MHIIISLQSPFTGSLYKNNANFWLPFTELLILYIYTHTHAHTLYMCPGVYTHMNPHFLILIAAHFMDEKLYDYITVQGYSHAKCSSQNTNVWVQSPCASTINQPCLARVNLALEAHYNSWLSCPASFRPTFHHQ